MVTVWLAQGCQVWHDYAKTGNPGIEKLRFSSMPNRPVLGQIGIIMLNLETLLLIKLVIPKHMKRFSEAFYLCVVHYVFGTDSADTCVSDNTIFFQVSS